MESLKHDNDRFAINLEIASLFTGYVFLMAVFLGQML